MVRLFGELVRGQIVQKVTIQPFFLAQTCQVWKFALTENFDEIAHIESGEVSGLIRHGRKWFGAWFHVTNGLGFPYRGNVWDFIDGHHRFFWFRREICGTIP